MSDIVERLRDPYQRSAWGSTLCSEAADEIERLREALKQSRLMNRSTTLTEHEIMQEENQKLREAADEINQHFIAKQYAFWDANITIGVALAKKKHWIPDYDKGGLWAVFAMHALSGGREVVEALNAADMLVAAFEERYGQLGDVSPAR